ncbi:MAG TPA: flavin reductase family protein, partial [Nitrobacter sp.]|nr:flavin reductase family protein [Nitrobacter sp.]
MEHIAALDAQQLRQAYSRLAAGTSVVTMIAPDGTKIGLTVSAVTSVSVEPPLMLVCINSKSRAISALETGAPFVINLLSRAQESVGMQFASREADKFTGVAHYTTDSG